MNKWIFTGNLGGDSELKYLPNGDAVCEFSVGVKSGYGDKEKTVWVKCSLFGKRAAGQLPQYLIKGAKVCIAGELAMDEWEKDGVKNKMLKINVGDLDLIGSNPNAGQQPQQQHYHPQQAPQQPQTPPGYNGQQNPQNAAYSQPQQGGFTPQQRPAQQSAPQPQNQFGQDKDIPFSNYQLKAFYA